MILDPDALDYLQGRRFSNGRDFPIGAMRKGLRRSELIMEIARDQKVLHVGCCDHLDLIQQKMATDGYLHQRLCRVARHCVGSDTNTEGLAMLRRLGFPEVYLPSEVPAEDFDVCLLADVIEHVGDVVGFLRSMRQYSFKRLVVVTPNAFRWRNFLPGAETINTDHRYWFTPYTLCKVMADAGFTPVSVELCHSDYVTWKGRTVAALTDLVPKWRDMLVVQAQP